MIALLLAAAASAFGPEALSYAGAGSNAAWQYVAGGIESSALWALVLLTRRDWCQRAIAAWAIAEALQRPVCRLAFDMHAAPDLGGRTLCEAATGLPAGSISVVCALALAALVQEYHRAGR